MTQDTFIIFDLQIKWLISFSSRDRLIPAHVKTNTFETIGQTGKNFVPKEFCGK